GADPRHVGRPGRACRLLHGGRARAALPRDRAPRGRGGTRGREPHAAPPQAALPWAPTDRRRAHGSARRHRKRHRSRAPQLPRAARLPQSVRDALGAAARLHGVRLDVWGVGLGPARLRCGDPAAGGAEAPTRGHHPPSRRRRLRSRGRPPPHGGGAARDHRRRAGGRLRVPAAGGASPPLLAVAFVVNLSSLVAKGWGWHLILKPVAPHRWRVAQEANLVGAAVNDLSVAVAGEAARVHVIAQRGGVPVAAALSSVVWTRVAEALALALFLVMAPSVLALESWLRALQVGVGLTLGIVLL